MAFADLLINTCTIKTPVQGPGIDSYGNPDVSWTDVLNQRCRLMAGVGRELKVGAEVVIADYKLFLEEDVVITEQDRVEMLVDGVTVTYEVLLVADRQDGLGSHHKECFMRTVR